jgi:hypothetical protein
MDARASIGPRWAQPRSSSGSSARLGDAHGAAGAARAHELERVTAFVRKLQQAMRRQQAPTVGAVLSVAPEDDAE